MNLSFSEEDLKFQSEVRSFIKENYPSEIKEKNGQRYTGIKRRHSHMAKNS